jgi:hypothetical protein
MIEAVRTSETSVNSYETTPCDVPDGCHLRQIHGSKFESWVMELSGKLSEIRLGYI